MEDPVTTLAAERRVISAVSIVAAGHPHATVGAQKHMRDLDLRRIGGIGNNLPDSAA